MKPTTYRAFVASLLSPSHAAVEVAREALDRATDDAGPDATRHARETFDHAEGHAAQIRMALDAIDAIIDAGLDLPHIARQAAMDARWHMARCTRWATATTARADRVTAGCVTRGIDPNDGERVLYAGKREVSYLGRDGNPAVGGTWHVQYRDQPGFWIVSKAEARAFLRYGVEPRADVARLQRECDYCDGQGREPMRPDLPCGSCGASHGVHAFDMAGQQK